MVENLNELARSIISENQYCSIATSNISGGAWISPVCYAFDQDWNLYFASMTTATHSMNLAQNKKAMLSIFDSRQEWGVGVGLQIEAEIEPIALSEFPRIAKIYATRKYPYGGDMFKAAMHFLESLVLHGKTYKMYRITPTTVWMNDPNADVDARVKIDLKA